MTRLRVYRVNVFLRQARGEQVAAVVAATSQRAAAERFGCSAHHLRTYGSETWNDDDRARALAEPGVVFWHTLRGPTTAWVHGRVELGDHG